MTSQIVYLVGVVAAAWAVTFLLRAFPFLLFAGKNRELPPAVERLAGYISPVIIAGLIVYSYYGLYTAKYFVPATDWAWPVLAGVLTVGLQLWKGNPLASILAGTILYMCLIGLTGCASVPVETLHSSPAKPLIQRSSELFSPSCKQVHPHHEQRHPLSRPHGVPRRCAHVARAGRRAEVREPARAGR